MFFFVVFFTAPPSFTKAPPPVVQALVGSLLSLDCAANGNPAPTITWLKDGSVIPSINYQVNNIVRLEVNELDKIYFDLLPLSVT